MTCMIRIHRIFSIHCANFRFCPRTPYVVYRQARRVSGERREARGERREARGESREQVDGMAMVDEMDGMLASVARWDVISFTRHARRRGARRNVAPDAVEYVLAHGRLVRRTGVMFFFLGRRDIPVRDRCASWATRLEGTIVVVSPDGGVVTVYRNRHGLRAIARKMKYRLFEPKAGGRQIEAAENAEVATGATGATVNADSGEPQPLMTARASA